MLEYTRPLTALSASRRERDTAGGPAAWTLFSAVGLAGLLLYLLIHQAVQPGFTDYWGFMVGQVAGTLVLVVALSVVFAREGGLSWYTHLVVTMNTWADTLGTAGHLYERHVSYDKITHFLAGVALTAAGADVLRAMNKRGWIRLALVRQLALAVAVALLMNIGWEFYEYVGDVVFNSERHRGGLDTAYDFASDLGGALVSALIIWILRAEATARGDPVHRTA
jgi:uncharacterized membrane protein YjdF